MSSEMSKREHYSDFGEAIKHRIEKETAAEESRGAEMCDSQVDRDGFGALRTILGRLTPLIKVLADKNISYRKHLVTEPYR